MHSFSYDLELPGRLARAWKDDERANNRFSEGCGNYDAIEFSFEDMLSLFDPVVSKILRLIQLKMMETSNVKAMIIDGGFSGSPYLIERIKREFSGRVARTIVVAEEPGNAFCCGAVCYGIYVTDVVNKCRGFQGRHTVWR